MASGHSQSSSDFRPAVRWATGIVAMTGLILVFLFQKLNWLAGVLPAGANSLEHFLINRAVRFVLNDTFAVLLVLAFFGKRKFVLIAVYAQLFGLVFVLLPYIGLKILYPYYNGPLISFLHRLVLNPLLVYLLIFYFWYQQRYAPASQD